MAQFLLHDDFPFDFPETEAGKAWTASTAADELQDYLRRPKAKRVNYRIGKIAQPFTGFWPEAGARALPSRGRRERECRESDFRALEKALSALRRYFGVKPSYVARKIS